VGQSFKAVAPSVRAGIYLADGVSFTNWLATIYPGQIAPGSYPFTPAPTLSVTVTLLDGEGMAGAVLDTARVTVAAPFMGFLDVDYAAAGVVLAPGNRYTIVVTDDASWASYPQGVSGWVVPSVSDPTPGAGQPVTDAGGNVVGYLPYGAYYDGHPILQGVLYANDAGIGDNAFRVLDATVAPPCDGTGVITSLGRDFIRVSGTPVWYTPTPAGTTFTGGVTGFQLGEVVTYSGTVEIAGSCSATSMTVGPAPAPITITTLALPTGRVGAAYTAAIAAAGGLAPLTITVTGLPAGLTFNGAGVTGTPTASGTFALAVTATDSLGVSATGSLSLTIDPASSSYTIKDEGKGKITAFGDGYVKVKAKTIRYDSTTWFKLNNAAAIKVGMIAQWKGLRDRKTGIVFAQRLEIN
jgi:hypothetical protein